MPYLALRVTRKGRLTTLPLDLFLLAKVHSGPPWAKAYFAILFSQKLYKKQITSSVGLEQNGRS